MAKGVKALFAKVSLAAALRQSVHMRPCTCSRVACACCCTFQHHKAASWMVVKYRPSSNYRVRAPWPQLTLWSVTESMHAVCHLPQVVRRRSTSAGMPGSPDIASGRRHTAAGYMSDESVDEEVEAVQKQHGMIRHDSDPSSLSQTPNSSAPGSMVSC